MNNHSKPIAIVTGASSGMGREAVIQLADRFGEKFSEIWVIARRRERLEDLQRQVPVPLHILTLNLQAASDRKILEEELRAHSPQVRMLINAAGFGKIGKIGALDLESETGMIQLNVEALCAVTHLVLPYMPSNSRIIQFASAAAFLPQPGFAIYAATKSFVLSYSRALREELRTREISVTAVCPGPVRTEFFDIAETTGKIPLYKRLTMADPHKVVRLALRDSMMGKAISVYGPWMKAFAILCKVLPHPWILAIMRAL